MPCYHPLPAWRTRTLNPETGKRGVTFQAHQGFKDRLHLDVPCGVCIGCTMTRAGEWATRATNESKKHDKNCFITLTYNDQHLPLHNSLSKRDVQLFLKRLRKHLGDERIRYFLGAEYGPNTHRPHYHMVLFGWQPSDGMRLSRPGSKHPLLTSKTLERLWGNGFTSWAPFTPETAGYVARYTVAKIDPDKVEKIPASEFWPRQPPFQLQSLGLGRDYIDDRRTAEYVAHWGGIRSRGGNLAPIPRYYMDRLEKLYPELYEKAKLQKRQYAMKHSENQTGPRLIVRETVHKARIKQLKRENL